MTSTSSSLGSKDKSDNAHIPIMLRDSVIMLSSNEVHTGKLFTVFIGVVDENYTKDKWTQHAERVSQLFNFDINYCVIHIQLNGEGRKTIDAAQMGLDVAAAIDQINNKQQERDSFVGLRIVGMGIHSCLAIYNAVEALVKGWIVQGNKKEIQFIALTDSGQGSFLNFCKSLCLKQLCANVQFYKAMDYDMFGYFSKDHHVMQQIAGGLDFENLTGNILTFLKTLMKFSKSSSAGSSTSENFKQGNDALIPFSADFKNDIERAKQDDVPSSLKETIENMSSTHVNIPFLIQDSLLNLSSSNACTGNVPTIFIGVVDDDYTNNTWMNHANRISKLFKFDIDSSVYHIQVKGENSFTIDAEHMGRDVIETLRKINNSEQENNDIGILRIVGMGIHSAIGVHVALEALIKGWKLQWDKKMVQFIALGDSKQGTYMNFCKSLCLKKICAKVQFYKTMDYDMFGYFTDDASTLIKKR